MVRALWTAATGMSGQQTNVDIIANNLSNVNTVAYKKARVEFKDLVYENRNKAFNLEKGENGEDSGIGLQVGLGARVSATLKDFTDGTVDITENKTDFAITGPGFFSLRNPEGEMVYTRDGSFKISSEEDGQMLVNSQGYPVLGADGEEITIQIEDIENLTVDSHGKVYIFNEQEGTLEETGKEIGIVRFENPAGLENIGSNNYQQTGVSGEPVWENALDDDEPKSVLMQGYLEGSNVQLVEEMVKLIVAQRAYEINSKTVQAADDMLQQANNLKR